MILALLASCTLAAAKDSAPAKKAIETNLLENGSFEWAPNNSASPSAWWFYTSKMGVAQLVTNVAHEGSQAVRLRAQQTSGGNSGLIQTLPVLAGRMYSLKAWVLKHDEDPLRGSAYGQLVIEWKDEMGREINRTWGKQWSKNIGHSDWERVEIRKAQAPPKAVQAAFGVHFYEGKSGGKGSLLVDDVVVTSP